MYFWTGVSVVVFKTQAAGSNCILEEGKSLVKKQYSKLLRLHKQIGSLKEKMEE